jgi:hypothetical protein
MPEMMEQEEPIENESEDIAGLKQILESNDINQIHEIAQGLLAKESAEAQAEQAEPDKRSFVDKMVEMHQASKEQPEQEMEK